MAESAADRERCSLARACQIKALGSFHLPASPAKGSPGVARDCVSSLTIRSHPPPTLHSLTLPLSSALLSSPVLYKGFTNYSAGNINNKPTQGAFVPSHVSPSFKGPVFDDPVTGPWVLIRLHVVRHSEVKLITLLRCRVVRDAPGLDARPELDTTAQCPSRLSAKTVHLSDQLMFF